MPRHVTQPRVFISAPSPHGERLSRACSPSERDLRGTGIGLMNSSRDGRSRVGGLRAICLRSREIPVRATRENPRDLHFTIPRSLKSAGYRVTRPAT